ncbi:HAMP domain-containing histidine kinase [Sphingobium sp. BYY-5]|uniref:HAMP domain-containing sensor histidine kinase n=1 Tax=Sphingobium sp. BYY-5 TaxID=2926400 RepID=UPI001FA70BCF|nr:HAMP domain-containing sensor histidine kinase [Sphingobium sp. BYY-5]MCI4590429.1 HAMP domain-containing histidine kinase [Sphingobium sp. BYY-5]
MIGRPTSLRGLTIAFLALFLTVTLAAGFGTFFATLSMINVLVDKRIETESHTLAPAGTGTDREELRRRIVVMTSRRDTADLGMLLTDAQGHVIAGNSRFTRVPPLGFSSLSRRDRIEGLSAGRVLVRDIGGGMRLAIFAETEPIDDYFAVRRRIYVAGFGAIVVVVLAGLLLFHRLIGERIGQMRHTAESIVEGDLSRRVPIAGDGGAFDQQAAALNHMLDRMNMLMAEVRNVSNDISHELRTPLARLRNTLSLLEQQVEAAPIRDELRLATEQADELLGMFGAMLRIAEIESGSRRAGFQPLAIDALIEEMVDMVRPLAEEGGHPVMIGRCDAVSLTGDRQLLSQMLLNLLENAVRHTPDGTGISVSAEKRDSAVILTVADAGPGIAVDQRALVMRRFSRLDHSGQRSGHGLGLPLADAIVRLHRGTMTLEDGGPGLRPGLRIVIRLPV